jgi:hypothetical protein
MEVFLHLSHLSTPEKAFYLRKSVGETGRFVAVIRMGVFCKALITYDKNNTSA